MQIFLVLSASVTPRAMGRRAAAIAAIAFFLLLLPSGLDAQQFDEFSRMDAGAAADAAPPANGNLAPLNAGQKFNFASSDAFSTSALVISTGVAGAKQGLDLYPEFHQGAAGFGRYYWHVYADQAVDDYVIEFMLCSALHEDPRYKRLGAGGFWHRTGYAFSRVVKTQSDAGRGVVNYAQLVGSPAASAVEMVYYPRKEWSAMFFVKSTAVDFAGAMMMKVYHEFAPDVLGVFHHRPKTQGE